MTTNSDIDPEALLQQALSAPDFDEVLRWIKQHREAFLNYLETPEAERFVELLDDEASTRLSILLDEITDPEDMPEEERLIVEALFTSAENAESRLGNAFSTRLLPGLPEDLLKFELFFDGVPPVDRAQYEYLKKSPVVQSALSSDLTNNEGRLISDLVYGFIQDLAMHGITPLTLVYAIESVSAMFEEALYAGIIETGQTISLEHTRSGFKVLPDSLSVNALVQEIAVRCDVTPATGRKLLNWNIAVARRKPYLFIGWRCTKKKHGVTFIEDSTLDEDDPFQKWSIEDGPEWEAVDMKHILQHLKNLEQSDRALTTEDMIEYTHKIGRGFLFPDKIGSRHEQSLGKHH